MKRKVRLHVQMESEKALEKEWLFDQPKVVTFGYSPYASVFLTESSGGPLREVFRRKGKEILLRVDQDLKGSILIGGENVPLADLREAGLLQMDKHGDFVPLRKKTSGTVQIGETIFRFWLSSPSRDLKFPHIPRIFSLLQSIQMSFFLFLIFSLALHSSIYTALKLLPQPKEPAITEIRQRIAKVMVSESMEAYVHKRIQTTSKRGTPSRRKRKQSKPSSMANAFFKAVATTNESGSSSPFSQLFTTESITQELEGALAKGSLDEILSKPLKGSSGSGLDLSSSSETVGIGSLRQNNTPAASLNIRISRPGIANLSSDLSETSGVIDRKELERVLNFHSGQLRDCYERALNQNKNLSGRVLISLIVQKDGTPRNTEITKSSIEDRSFQRCIIRRISAWMFPRPKGGETPVRFPLIFTASSQG